MLRRSLLKYSDRLRDELWEVMQQSGDGHTRALLRAASALALYDPDSPRWEAASASVVAALVSENALHSAAWIENFYPVRRHLLPPLASVFCDREGTYTLTQRDLATNILESFAADDAVLLSQLVLEAEPDQFVRLFDELAAHGDPVIERFEAELSRELRFSWNDEPIDPSWPQPNPSAVRAIQEATGLLHDRFAFCQDMPLDRFLTICATLRMSRYRPLRVRPYQRDTAIFVAAVWKRDPLDWQVVCGLAQAEIMARDEQLRAEGFRAIDVAGYVDRSDSLATERFCGVWAWQTANDEKTRIHVSGTVHDFEEALQGIDRAGFEKSISLQAFRGSNDLQRYCGVRSDGDGSIKTEADRSSEEFGSTEYLSMTLMDVDISSATMPETSEQQNRRKLAEADATLADKPRDLNARQQRAEALFWLEEYDKSIAEINRLIDDNPQEPKWFHFRAIALARRGKESQAQADVSRFKQLRRFVPDVLLLEAVVSAALGRDTAGMDRLEAFVEKYAASDLASHYGAMAYAMASSAVADRDEAQAERYADRAVALLERAMKNGMKGYYKLQIQPELAAVHRTSRFKQFIAAGNLEIRYAALWHTNAASCSTESHNLPPQEHLERCRSLIADGYRPVTISAAYMPSQQKTVTASAWHRPRVSESDQDSLARRQGNAALGLLRLGHQEKVWPLLRHSSHPSRRTYIIHRSCLTGVDPALLSDRLSVESDETIRRALVLCLGEYSSLSTELQASIAQQLIACCAETNDAGLHATADFVLRKWGRGEEIARMDQVDPAREPRKDRHWYHTSLGQKMIIFQGPLDFMMGSPCTGRKIYAHEPLHRRSIRRSFAIGATEVTVEQFRQFRQAVPSNDHYYSKMYSPESSCPQGSVTWYDAASFCRWLSEVEGVPEDQMCYPSMDDIQEGMTLPADFITRTGYRLPTEAEWEYACQAGSSVNRFYGRSADLMRDYAWCAVNSEDRTWPVASRLPNDFGLFDVYGNVHEWCQDTYAKYPVGNKGKAIVDRPSSDVPISPDMECMMRGGGYTSMPREIESAFRERSQPATRTSNIGFRLARTIVPAKASE